MPDDTDVELQHLREALQVGLDAMARGDYDDVPFDELDMMYLPELGRPDGPRDEVMRRWRCNDNCRRASGLPQQPDPADA